MGGILGLYRDNGKENGNYHNGVCRIWGIWNLIIIYNIPKAIFYLLKGDCSSKWSYRL